MLSLTVSLARSFNVTPFEIMAQDCDEVIMIINYFAQKSDGESGTASPVKDGKQEKIKVTDKTATGGWW